MPMPFFSRLSITAKLSLALLLLALPGFISILLSGWITNLSAGGGEAINMAGSLRKQTYLISATVLSAHDSAQGNRREVDQAIAEFERRLYHASIANVLPADKADPVRQHFEAVAGEWKNHIRGELEREVKGANPGLLPAIHGYVDQLDQFVSAMEKAHESRLQLLMKLQWISLLIIAIAFVMIVLWTYHNISYPITVMASVARQVQNGRFEARIGIAANSEIGLLKNALNNLFAELQASYSQLEARVTEKTAALEQSQTALQLRYRIKALLADHEPDQAIFDAALKELTAAMPIRDAAICLTDQQAPRDQPIIPAFKLANNQQQGIRLGCLEQDCEGCLEHSKQDCQTDRHAMVFTLRDAGVAYGIMPVTMNNGVQADDWHVEVLEDVSRMLGTALASARRKQSLHRLALFEERSVIARELHDSLAQALSYLKIQVLRLQGQLQNRPEDAQATLLELREGLNSAYRQLRELLTTFRLQINHDGLHAALMATVEEFSDRCGINISLSNKLLGVELAAEEEIHVLQIVREALANVHHHAQAENTQIHLDWIGSEIVVSIKDDGKGLDPNPEKRQHYGLSIMRDRARSLGGQISMQANEPRGTQVILRFAPLTPFANQQIDSDFDQEQQKAS